MKDYRNAPKIKKIHLLKKLFPNKKIIIMNDKGDTSYFKLSTSIQTILSVCGIVCVSFIIGLICLYIFYFSNIMEMFEEKKKLEQSYKNLVTEVTIYKDNVVRLSNESEKNYRNTIMLLEKRGAKLSRDERDTILKNRVFLTSEYEYVGEKIEELYQNVKSHDLSFFGSDKSTYEKRAKDIQDNMKLAEIKSLKERNRDLENTLLNMQKLQLDLFDKIDNILDLDIKEINEQTFDKLNTALWSAGYNKNSIISRYKKIKNTRIGGLFVKESSVHYENEKIQLIYSNLIKRLEIYHDLNNIVKLLPYGKPLHTIVPISNFGVRNDPFTGELAEHTGMDFIENEETPIYATRGGRVKKAGKRYEYGNAVEIEHLLGFSTLYAHMSRVAVKVGDEISEGQIIGFVGNTGRSTGPHLHYEVRIDDHPINPHRFVIQ